MNIPKIPQEILLEDFSGELKVEDISGPTVGNKNLH
jgi:hypothetical protein